jgi:hypothetical protein
LLRDELTSCFKRPNFVSQICQSFEGSLVAQGTSEQNAAAGGGGYVVNLCHILKLSPATSVALAYCLTQSKLGVFASESLSILKAKLPELNSTSSILELNEEILRGLIQLIRSSEVHIIWEKKRKSLALTLSYHHLFTQSYRNWDRQKYQALFSIC